MNEIAFRKPIYHSVFAKLAWGHELGFNSGAQAESKAKQQIRVNEDLQSIFCEIDHTQKNE